MKKILILYTGGTFGMEKDPAGKTLYKVPRLSAHALASRIKTHVPEIFKLAKCEIRIVLNRDSSHMDSEHWLVLSHHLRAAEKKFDGFVILHGTDTLAYTASALSLLLLPIRKPIVITGAQRPLAELRSDARRNLISSVEIAASAPRPYANQVLVFFDDQLLLGSKVRKRSATDFDAFESPSHPVLAKVGSGIHYSDSFFRKPKRLKKISLKRYFQKNVAAVLVTPHFPSTSLPEASLKHLGAVLLMTFPSGTGPTHDPEFIQFLSRCRKIHLPVVLVSEQWEANPKTYSASRIMVQKGGIWAGAMTAEYAFVKTSLILGQLDSNSPVKRLEHFKKLWKQIP